jgi:hypothetical protein
VNWKTQAKILDELSELKLAIVGREVKFHFLTKIFKISFLGRQKPNIGILE